MTDTKMAVHQTPARTAKPKLAPGSKAGRNRVETLEFAAAHKGSGLSFAPDRPGSDEGQPCVNYVQGQGIDDFVASVHAANPMQLIETERAGVASIFVKDLAKRMDIPAQRMFEILGVPKATAEKKVAAGELLAGSGGRAALGIARLLGIVKEIVDDSTAGEAKGFDTAKWLGQWLERPQPALGGRKPAALIDTPTGLEVVARLLGAIQSGAYQ